MAHDVLTLGEALLRLTPPDSRRFEQATLLEMHIGGSELNTAVGLARLGLSVTWLSRLPDNVLGRLVEKTLLTQGVDGSHIIWTPSDRMGIYYMEEGKGARASQVTYDRANSAMSRIQPDDVVINDLMPAPPRWLHLTGITLALSDSCAATTRKLLARCLEDGVPVSFDLNYRARLWSVDDARTACMPYCEAASILFIPARDARTLFGTDDLNKLHTWYPGATVVMTRGADGAAAITSSGTVFTQPIFQTETVCRVGGGDAFSAGFLYAHLANMTVQDCLRYGAAMAALKYSLAGDMPLVDEAQIHQLVATGHVDTISR